MIDLLFTPPISIAFMIGSFVVGFALVYFLRNKDPGKGKPNRKKLKKQGFNKKQIVALPLLVVGLMPLLNPWLLHWGYATSLTRFGAGADTLWAIDVQVSTSDDSRYDDTYHYRLHILDPSTGARVSRRYLGMGASVRGEDEAKLYLSESADRYVIIDKRTGDELESFSLRDRLQKHGVTAAIDEVNGLGGYLDVRTKDAERHIYDLRADALVEKVPTRAPKTRPPVYVNQHRLYSDATRAQIGDEKAIHGKVIYHDDALALVQHYQTTDRLAWRITAVRPDGEIAWRVDEAAAFPGGVGERGEPKHEVAGGLLLLSWEGRLAVVELDSGKLRFSVRV